MKDFVRANNPYKIGDKITDHIGTVIFEKMGFNWGYLDKPCAIYFGTELNKDGKPNKKGSKRQVYQTNIV